MSKKLDELTETGLERKVVDIVAKQTRTARATKIMAAAAVGAVTAPSKWPIFFGAIGVIWMGIGIWKMEFQHVHPEKIDWTHASSDWGKIAIGIAFIPGAGEQVGNGLKSLARGVGSMLRAVRGKNGGAS